MADKGNPRGGGSKTFLKPSRDGLYADYGRFNGQELKDGQELVNVKNPSTGEEFQKVREYFNGGTTKSLITNLELKEGKYGDFLEIEFASGDVVQIPQMSGEIRYNKHYELTLLPLPNVDFAVEYSYNAFAYEDGSYTNGKGETKPNYTYKVYFNHGEKDARGKYSESVGWKHIFGQDVPPSRVTRKRGKDVRDYDEQQEFLHNSLLKQIERFKKFKADNPTTAAEQPVSQGTEEGSDEPVDDLPF